MPAPLLQFKRGNAGVAGTVPALRPGEPAISLNNFDFFIGIDTSVVNNKFFGSHRYWERENGTNSLKLKLVSNNGAESVNLRAPTGLGATINYTLPGIITSGYFLKTNATGELSWAEVVSNINIAADSGTADNVSTGSTITFVGGTNVNTAVTDNTITINLDDNVNVSGVITASAFSGALSGTATTSTRATLIDTTNTTNNSDYYVTFVDTLAGQNSETLRVGVGLSVNPFTGNVGVSSILSVGNINQVNSYIRAGGGSNAMYLYSNGDVSFQAKIITNSIRSSSDINNAISLQYRDVTLENNVKIVGVATIGTGVGITQFSGAISIAGSTSSVPTSSAVIDYIGSQIGNVDLTLGITADTGGPSTVSTASTLTISGTANEVETSVSGQTIAVGLPNSVTITTSLTTPTVNATSLKANDGTAAITISNTTGKVSTNSDLTVGGNLYVNGSTTQVNTSELAVYDRTITLGIQSGTTPTTTTWDLGILMNYGDAGVAKTAGMIWDYATRRFAFGYDTDNPSSTGTTTPQIGITSYAAIEVAELWINNSCSSGSTQVIGCVGSELRLQNVVIDAENF